MISLSKVLSGKPILITNNIYFYQPTIQEIVDMDEAVYWMSLNMFIINRKDIVKEENEFTKELTDYDIWKNLIFSNPSFQKSLYTACEIFLHEKIEFFNISNTIYIGEKGLGIILDERFYYIIRELCQKLISYNGANKKEEERQYKETENMSEKEKRMIEKMKASEAKIEAAKNKNSNPEDSFGRKILGLVAIGHYTIEQVYDMTMLQFNLLLEKYVEIQSFEIRSALAPYISSDDSQESKFWLD